MNAKARRKLEMAQRALEFSRAHPDASPGYAVAVSRLEERLARAEQLAAQQRDGFLQVRAASARKRELRRTMRQTHLTHLARVARIAARELPELAQKFVVPPQATPYLAFRTAARGLHAEAENRRELLVRHGLAETLLESLTQALDELDAAIVSGNAGRQAHVGASTELDEVADEVVQIVGVMDALNRFRFAGQPELLGAWESASEIVGPFRPAKKGSADPRTPETPPAGGEVRPAA